jgi:hypothetical protein
MLDQEWLPLYSHYTGIPDRYQTYRKQNYNQVLIKKVIQKLFLKFSSKETSMDLKPTGNLGKLQKSIKK